MATKKKKENFNQEPEVKVVESTKTHQYDIFTVVEHNGNFLIALGNQIVSKQKCSSLDEAQNFINSKPWELILNATAVMMAKINEQQSK